MKKPIGLAFLLVTLTSYSQIIFNEDFTNLNGGTSGDAISTHETNNRFDNTSLTFSGNGIIRNTQQNIPADYLESSSDFNIELDQNQNLIIDGIDATSQEDLILSFGIRKSTITENGSNFKISYSTSGSNGTYTELTWDIFPTGVGTTGWYYRFTEVIPNTVTSIKFESNLNDLRIDDIKLHTPNPILQLKGNEILINESNTPNEFDFTDFGKKTTNYSFTTNSFTITNKGIVPLIISSITNSNTTDFSIDSITPFSIAVNSEISIPITFKPQSTGNKTAIITINSNDSSNTEHQFTLSGEGLETTICNTTTEIIKFQSFENNSSDNWSYTLTNSTGISIAGNTAYAHSGKRGNTNLFFDTKSLQINNSSTELLFDSINTSEYSNTTLHFNLGSYSTTAGNGSDVDDVISVYVSTNNGVTWKHELQITGYNNSKWSLDSGVSIASKSYEDNLVTFTPTSGGYKLDEGYSHLVLTELPTSDNLLIKLLITNDKENEIWAVDNIKITGTKTEKRIWENNSWNTTNLVNLPYAEVTINDDYDSTINGNIESCICTINSGQTVTINQEDYITIHGNLTNNGTLNIKDTGSLIQINDNSINSGAGHFRRHSTPMKKYDYTYWSSPVQDQTLENFSSGSVAYSFASNINNWVSTTGTMNPGKGYIIRAPDYIDYSGGNVSFNGDFYGIPNNGIINQNLSKTNSEWNLLGNPYPSAIHADLFINNTTNSTNTNGTIYFWTHTSAVSNGNSGIYTSDDYASYNQTGGVAAVSGSEIPLGYINSGQGFFIEALQNSTVVFNNSMRVKGNNDQFFRNTTNTKSRLWLELINQDGAYKQLLIGYIFGATNKLDRNFDGKAKEAGNHISFYSINKNQNLSIQGRKYPFNTDDIVSLGYSSTIDGEFQIQLAKAEGDVANSPIVLYDTETKSYHQLGLSPYHFKTNKGTYDKRFRLYYKESVLSTNNLKTNEISKISTISKSESLQVASTLENILNIIIYNSNGTVLFKKSNINTKHYNTPLASQKLVLIVSTTLVNGEIINTKIIH